MSEPPSDAPADDLAGVLGATPPDAVAALPDDVRARLAGQVRAAAERQASLVESSTQAALDGVPLPVRGLVRRALGR